jgi:rhamnose utilization protein RhaD (predicted bifunctional aldolase and dehydrogenase)
MDYLKGFIEISHYAGKRPDIVQAGGGNSSVKLDDGTMLIKASGYQMADITADNGYATVNHKILADYFKNPSAGSVKTENELLNLAHIAGSRPSIETFLHAATGTYTLHSHPVVVNALTTRCGGMDSLKALFPEALIVGYAKPGMELVVEYYKSRNESKSNESGIYETVFLKNHGLIVSAKTAAEVIEKHEAILKKIEAFLGCDMSIYHNATTLNTVLDSVYGPGVVWAVSDHHVLEAFRKLKNNLWNYCYCPDYLVYCGKNPLTIENEGIAACFQKYRLKYGKPVIIVFKDHLYIYAPTVKKAMEIQVVLSSSAQVFSLNEGHVCDLLTEQEQNVILNWESEKYRQNI